MTLSVFIFYNISRGYAEEDESLLNDEIAN